MTAHTDPIRCLRWGCDSPATHWYGGAPYCEQDAYDAADDEGITLGGPVAASPADLATYYTRDGRDPALRVRR